MRYYGETHTMITPVEGWFIMMEVGMKGWIRHFLALVVITCGKMLAHLVLYGKKSNGNVKCFSSLFVTIVAITVHRNITAFIL